MVTKKVIAWSLYDFADTAFSALFITFFFPILIKAHLGGNEFQIGLTLGLSILLAAFLVPLIGAISDATGRRMPILVITAFLTALFGALTGYTQLLPALMLAFFANITHLISKDVYDAKMIDIVPPSRYGSLSGLGVAIGYFGTIASLAIGYFLLSYFGWESLRGIQAMFWEAGAFYIIFSLPLFFLVPDQIRTTAVKWRTAFMQGLAEIRQTLAGLSQFPTLSRFLAASFFYNNGMNTVIIFLALYGREVIGLTVQKFFPIFALMALAAAIGSLLFGRLSDQFGPIKMINVALFMWIAIIIFLIFVTSYSTFLIAGMLGGAALGAIWTLNRHMIANISPRQKIAEWFGFEGLTEKFSGVIGPIIFGYLVVTFNYTIALVSLIAFFLVGLMLMPKK